MNGQNVKFSVIRFLLLALVVGRAAAAALAVKPPGGVLLDGAGDRVVITQVSANPGAKVATAKGKEIRLEFDGKGAQSVQVKPATGMWNLGEYLQVRVRLRNTGPDRATPSVQLLSPNGPSDAVMPKKPIEPQESLDIIVPFIAAVPWRALDLPEMRELDAPRRDSPDGQPGTGTKYASNTTTGIEIAAKTKCAFDIISIKAEMPPPKPLPAWLGKRPPVAGDWMPTFEEDFNGNTIDLKKWNIYSSAEWHVGNIGFSKDNVLVRDGRLAMRLEKRRVHHNDNPAYAVHDYAAANVDTFGKWTQRYGYFEARLKLPSAPGSYPAFWLFPDRGIDWDPKQHPTVQGWPLKREETKVGGMEFDILEQLSAWGPYRHQFGAHWDSYGKFHKTTGTFTCYYPPDKEGCLTVGMLWTPGLIVMYQQGREAARWESPRIGSVQSTLNFQHITGGAKSLAGEAASSHGILLQYFNGEEINDRDLPSDLLIDYVRVWQRKDLASPEDGPKPNDGGPLPPAGK